MEKAAKILRRTMILSHRYLGIAISLLVVMWFASGIVMMYAGGMPNLATDIRIERIGAVDFTKVTLTPIAAAERIGFAAGEDPGDAVLLTIMERPAYRFGGGNGSTVFADNGDVMEALSVEQSRAVASSFLNQPLERVQLERTLAEVDQWTLGQQRNMPLHKFDVDDGSGTEIYIQPGSGEVSMLTTGRARFLAWIGVIPHWLYFRALRVNQPLWYDIVVWTSAFACVLALLGLILGVTELRRSRKNRLGVSIPYAGWMRWHYVSGAIFGLTTLGFAYSGLLSMEPFEWTNAEGLDIPGDVLTGGPVQLAEFRAPDAQGWNAISGGRAVKEITYSRIMGEPYYVVRLAPETAAEVQRRERLHQPYGVTGREERDRLLVHGQTLETRSALFATDALVTRLTADLADVPVVETTLLTDYDSYYYSRGRLTPLPVLRVKFGDPAETWAYLDPEMAEPLTLVHRLNRWERWLYNGLHNFDFQFLYDHPPLWDVVMLLLCFGGLASSGIGLYLGMKRMGRGTRRAIGAVGGHGEPSRRPAE